jgi:hypothetical protein
MPSRAANSRSGGNLVVRDDGEAAEPSSRRTSRSFDKIGSIDAELVRPLNCVAATRLSSPILLSSPFARHTTHRLREWLLEEVQRRAVRFFWEKADPGCWPHGLINDRAETGSITCNHADYCGALLLYLLGLAAPVDPLPPTAWEPFERPLRSYQGIERLKAAPIFIHQMPSGYFYFANQRDKLGFDYWVAYTNAMKIYRRFCIDHADDVQTYAQGFWGFNASCHSHLRAANKIPLGE